MSDKLQLVVKAENTHLAQTEIRTFANPLENRFMSDKLQLVVKPGNTYLAKTEVRTFLHPLLSRFLPTSPTS